MTACVLPTTSFVMGPVRPVLPVGPSTSSATTPALTALTLLRWRTTACMQPPVASVIRDTRAITWDVQLVWWDNISPPQAQTYARTVSITPLHLRPLPAFLNATAHLLSGRTATRGQPTHLVLVSVPVTPAPSKGRVPVRTASKAPTNQIRDHTRAHPAPCHVTLPLQAQTRQTTAVVMRVIWPSPVSTL